MKRIAIIGTGISGSLVARLLSTQHDVTVFEANNYPGGHANTVDVSVDGKRLAVDTGFMVFNQRTYPNFCRLLELLEIQSQPSDMSFSVRCDQTGLEYQGSSLNGLFAQRMNLLRPSFLGMLGDIAKFNRLGMKAVATGELKDGRTVHEFVTSCRLGSRFVDQYLVPMAAAIWSSSPQEILGYPAEFMLGFFSNHGLMQLLDRPQWRTIVGGSRNYVETLLEPIWNRIRLCSPVEFVARSENDVIVKSTDGPRERFDEVVFASHADQALDVLADASRVEQHILGAFPYQPNEAILHTDTRQLPSSSRAWASWNYRISAGEQRAASLTYDLSRLQLLDSSTPVLLTLNPRDAISSDKVLRTFNYHHPAYSRESIPAQRRFKETNGQRHTHFCGAYWGYGFHEDGVNSALAVAANFGIGLDACTVASTKEPSRTGVTSR